MNSYFSRGSDCIIRIIAGSAGGRFIKTPSGLSTRPTSSQVRESLFNILGECVNDAYIIDMFSGSGAIGIEALSRGAAKAFFIDNDKRCCDIIKWNVVQLGFDDKALIIKCDALKVALWDQIISEACRGSSVKLVIADPPYDLKSITDLPKIISASSVVSDTTLLVIEHSDNAKMPETTDEFCIYKEKKYSGKVITFYSKVSY